MFLCTICLLILSGLVYFYIVNKRRYNLAKIIPGPKGWPLIGNIELTFLTSEDIFFYFPDLRKKFGSFYKLWIFNELWIVLSDPKDCEIILTNRKHLTKSTGYRLFEPWLGTGLLTSTGSKWFKRRKALTPAFHFKILEDFVNGFDTQSQLLVDKLEKLNLSKPLDIYNPISLCTLDIICETSMGVSVNAQSNSESEYCQAINNAAKITLYRMFNPLLRIDWIFPFFNYSTILKQSLEIIRKYTKDVITQRRTELNSRNDWKITETGNGYPSRRMPLLDVLLHTTIDDIPLTDDDIMEEVNTFMFEGHDTTSSAITYFLYNIARYPNIQQTVYEEIEAEIGKDKTKIISYQQLNNLKYLEMAIKESLRLHPPVPYISRINYEETTISNGRVLPANSNVSIPIYLMNHDPDIFTNPEEFIPERFNSTTDTEQQPFSYIPFSAGYRNCIGQKFAMLELKTVLSKVLRYFVVKLPENPDKLRISLELILKPANGMFLILEKRL